MKYVSDVKSFFIGFLLCTSSVLLMGADLPSLFNSAITDATTGLTADVELISGKNRLQTSGLVQIDQLFGQDVQATSYWCPGTCDDANGIGSAGDTVRFQIPAAVTPLATVYPAVDVTSTVTAGHVADPNPERAFATTACADLNGDANFTLTWKCEVIKDFSGVFISNKLFNEFGERTSWTVVTTGTTTGTQGFGDLLRRGYPAELSRSPNDPRKGQLAISGTIAVFAESAADQFIEFAENPALSKEMNIDCAPVVANCTFTIFANGTKDKIVTELRFVGQGNGIQYTKFLNLNTALTNGILVTAITEGNSFTYPIIFATEDFKHFFARGAYNWALDIQSGADDFLSSLELPQPIKLLAGSSDHIQIEIRDDIDQVSLLQFLALGFNKEP